MQLQYPNTKTLTPELVNPLAQFTMMAAKDLAKLRPNGRLRRQCNTFAYCKLKIQRRGCGNQNHQNRLALQKTRRSLSVSELKADFARHSFASLS